LCVCIVVHDFSPKLEKNENAVYSLAELKEKYCPDEESDDNANNDSESESRDSEESESDDEHDDVGKQTQKVKDAEVDFFTKHTDISNEKEEKEETVEESLHEDENIVHEKKQTLLQSIPLHTKSCRAVQLSHDGRCIYTGGADSSICCLYLEYNDDGDDSSSTGLNIKLLWKIENACQGKAVNCLQILPEHTYNNTKLFVTGDDEGTVRIWDADICGKAQNQDTSNDATNRKKRKEVPDSCNNKLIGCVAQLCCHRDFVADMVHDEKRKVLLTTSGDCTLCVIDIRKAIGYYTRMMEKSEPIPKTSQLTINNDDDADRMKEKYKLQRKCGVVGCSDDVEDELVCLSIVKGGTKLVIGTQQGVLTCWSWGKWEDMDDRFTGHPSSVDALLKVDEDTILTGSMDGFIRIVQLYPHKFLGVMGSQDGFPVEALRFSHDRKVIASLGCDNLICLWDASVLDDEEKEEKETEGERGSQLEGAPAADSGLAAVTTKPSEGDGWEDAEIGDEDSNDDTDSDSDDDDEPNKKEEKRFKTESEKFFSGLE
jgi:WD40 repeat protein